jgi:hypothetical protein
MKKTVTLMLAVLLAASGLYAQTGNGRSEITVKRTRSSINAGFREQIYIDGINRLTLTNGVEGKIIIPDGEHTILAKLSSLTSGELRFSVRSGSVTFTVTPLSVQQLVIEQQGESGSRADAPAASTNQNDGVVGSLERAAKQIGGKIPAGSRIAIVYVTAGDSDVAEYIAGELEFILVNQGFIVIDRSQLDRIRQEQDFQLSGEVDDAHAVSIGKIAGANVIITGAVTGTGSLRRLRLRTLDTQTAQILSAASERY